MKNILKQLLPWLITFGALYYAFHAVHWGSLLTEIRGANGGFLVVATLLTVSSYIFRARRWQSLFLKKVLCYGKAYRVLVYGFFMNNILPARAGEIIRAHLGSKASGETRTLVLATIASERLLDGLTISLFFFFFAFQLEESRLSQGLQAVAFFFLVATAITGVLVALRKRIGIFIEEKFGKPDSKLASYLLNRTSQFIRELSPLFLPRKVPTLVVWSALIWLIELCVFFAVICAYDAPLSLAGAVVFLVATNFASLFPAAPGGIGVIEAVVATALMSLGVEREQALALAITQHAIQYLVIGVQGIYLSIFSPQEANEARQMA